MANSSSSTNVTAALSTVIVLSAVLLIVYIWAYVRIIRRAGYSGWWFLISVVPVVNVVMFLVFAFKEWPIQRELAMLRMQLAGRGGYQQSGYGYPPSGYGDPPYGSGSATGW
jgi:uncharacterized membrane protein YhaH (DUF805 family)